MSIIQVTLSVSIALIVAIAFMAVMPGLMESTQCPTATIGATSISYNLPYNDTLDGSATLNADGGYERVGEQFASGSSMVGESVTQVKIWLYDPTGTDTGTVTVNFRHANDSVAKQVATFSVGTVSNSFAYADSLKTLNLDSPYVIQAGDYLSIEYSGANPGDDLEVLVSKDVDHSNVDYQGTESSAFHYGGGTWSAFSDMSTQEDIPMIITSGSASTSSEALAWINACNDFRENTSIIPLLIGTAIVIACFVLLPKMFGGSV